MARYKYRALLNARDIRLLIVLSGSSGKPLRCRFRHVSLDSLQFPYEAISYYWGEPVLDHLIYHVDVTTKTISTLHVTKNLHDAVCNLRGNDDKACAVWIDGVCINQEDVDERNGQVRLMRHIYESAACTHIWLGEPADDSAVAIRLLRNLASEWKGQEEAPNAEEIFQVPSTQLLHWNDKERASVKSFLHRPWFTRIWCIQEAASTPPAIVHCGNDSILYNDIVFIAIRLHIKGATNAFYNIKALSSMEYPGIRQTQLVQHFWQMRHSGMEITLANILSMTQDLSYTNPRDRIYALLGLAVDGEDPFLLPGYGLSPEDVFLRTATCLIVKRKSLELLYGLSLPRLHSSLPSWVPSFHGRRVVQSFHASSQLAQFNACATRSPKISLQKGTNALSILGAVVDTVSATTDACFENSEEWKLNHQETAAGFLTWISQAENLSEMLQPYTATREPLQEAIWRTLCADHTSNGIAPAPKYFGLCFRVWRHDANWRLSNSLESSTYEVKAPAVQSLELEIAERVPESFKNQKASTDFGQVMASTSHRQRFCVTNNGHLGKVPVNARGGDRICILFGGPVPFLLRPLSGTEDMFELVGDCFVHGYMRGEKAASFEKSAKTLSIC